MKKILITLAVIAMCIAVAIPVIATTVNSEMKIVVEYLQTSANKDDEITAIVSVKNYKIDSALGGIQYELSYDTSVLSFVNAEVDSNFYELSETFADVLENPASSLFNNGDESVFFSLDSTNGSLKFVSVCADMSDSSTGYKALGNNFTLFTVKFKANADVSSVSSVLSTNSSFNGFGSTSAEEISPDSTNPYETKEVSNAITNIIVKSFGTDNAYVKLFKSDNTETPVKTAVTNSDADFYNVDAGSYSLMISKQYYLPYIISIDLSDGAVYDVSNTERLQNQTEENKGKIVLIAGDIDDNGVVDANDLAFACQHNEASGSEATVANGDINCDGTINTDDISYIVQYIGAE